MRATKAVNCVYFRKEKRMLQNKMFPTYPPYFKFQRSLKHTINLFWPYWNKKNPYLNNQDLRNKIPFPLTMAYIFNFPPNSFWVFSFWSSSMLNQPLSIFWNPPSPITYGMNVKNPVKLLASFAIHSVTVSVWFVWIDNDPLSPLGLGKSRFSGFFLYFYP